MGESRRRHLVLSTFPPRRCGIGSYAAEQVLRLKQPNTQVVTFGLGKDCGGNIRLNIQQWRSILGNLMLVRPWAFDSITLHYTDGLFEVPPKGEGWRMGAKLAQAFMLFYLSVLSFGRLTITMHELIDKPGRGRWWQGVRRMAFRHAGKVEFHTELERQQALRVFKGALRPERTELVAHHRFMQRRVTDSRAEAKAALDLRGTVFLCCGFLQQHKGFDRAIRAVDQLPADMDVTLAIVGGMRVEAPEIVAYRDNLAALAARSPRTRFIERFVDDDELDRWIAASDVILLPYTEIWSTGIGARAMVADREVIHSDLPTFGQQFAGYGKAAVFRSDAEFVKLLGDAHGRAKARGDAEVAASHGTRTLVQVAGRRRLLFVIPLFGEQVGGGAERFIAELAECLIRFGTPVEVWATDSDALTGWNHRLRDATTLGPVPVRRFPAGTRSEKLFHWLHARENRGRTGRFHSWAWARANLYGHGMTEALEKQADDFSSIHLFHYLTGTAHRLMHVAPHKTVLHPFVHDETIARSVAMIDLFSLPRGIFVNSRGEAETAMRKRGGVALEQFHVLGNVVEVAPAYLRAPGLTPRLARVLEGKVPAHTPYVLYLGRVIHEKNVGALLEWHRALQGATVQPHLVLAGEGSLSPEQQAGGGGLVHHLGFVDEAAKHELIDGAVALVQPSLLESFSLVMIEAWLHGVPCIAHGHCPATSGHITRCGGGFSVVDAEQYRDAVLALMSNPKLWSTMAEQGRRYASETFSAESVVRRFHEGLDRLSL